MALRIHPLLNDPNVVVVYREPVPEVPAWADYSRIAKRIMEIMQVSFEGEGIAIKPNVTSGEHFADPDTGITTHPAFCGGIVEWAREHGANPDALYVVEDPKDSDDDNPRHWKKTGFLEMCEQTGCKLDCPTDQTVVEKIVPRPFVHPTRRVSKFAVDPNFVLINVPKMKTHNLGITTLGLKNLMGLDRVFDRHYCGYAWQDIPKEMRHDDRSAEEWMTEEIHEIWEEGLGKRLADLAQVVKPQLNVVEGVIGREGTGFNRGKNFPLGMTIAGVNIVAVDALTSYIMGFDPLHLPYLRVAAAIGLGENDLAKLKVYVVQDGSMVPCQDVAALRAKPAFRVIRSVIGDQERYDKGK